jgi:hypothetical protein
MPEPAFWTLFGSAATIILQRTFRWLRALERPATPTEYERARAEWKQMRAR